MSNDSEKKYSEKLGIFEPTEGRSRAGGLRFGSHLSQSRCASIRLVYSIVGNISKLRENPEKYICIRSPVPSLQGNLWMVLVNC
jgi:hypothetical protein